MARHVWLSGRFSDGTLRLAAGAFRKAVAGGLGYDDVCRFVGYVAETCRQRSLTAFRWDPHDGPKLTLNGVSTLWPGALKSGHRYAKGRNRENYRAAGERLMGAAAAELGFIGGTDPRVIYDHYLEFGRGPS